MRITERDLNVLISLSKYRFLTLKQLMKLHFPNRIKAQQRLKMMFDDKLIGRTVRPAVINKGKAEYVYFLKRRALDIIGGLIGQQGFMDIGQAIPSRIPRTLNHILDINQVGIIVETSTRQLNRRIKNDTLPDTITDTLTDTLNSVFIPEYLRVKDNTTGKTKSYLSGKIKFAGSNPRFKYLTPDFLLVIEQQGASKTLFFGEVDRGTEIIDSPNAPRYVFKDKVESYIKYFDSGAYGMFGKDFETAFQGFRLLIITSSQRRLQNILNSILQFNDIEFIWLATQDRIEENILTSKIWRIASPDDSQLKPLISINT